MGGGNCSLHVLQTENYEKPLFGEGLAEFCLAVSEKWRSTDSDCKKYIYTSQRFLHEYRMVSGWWWLDRGWGQGQRAKGQLWKA